MKVAQLVATRRMEVFESDLPELPPGQVLVRVRAAGICGSDVHYFTHGGLGSFKAPLPMSLGHEAAGEVVETGQRVAIDPARPCGECLACRSGRSNLCSRGSFMGANEAGALSEYIAASPGQLLPIPNDMSFEAAAMLEPLAVAEHAVGLSRLMPGESVAIQGAGPIGMCLAMAAAKRAPRCVVLSDPLAYRKEAADQFGARWPADGKLWFDVVFDAAGTQQSVEKCCCIAAPGGRVVLVGIPTVDTLCYNPHLLRTKELSVISTRRSAKKIEYSALPLGGLVTHRFDIDHVQDAFETAAGYRDGILKGVIVFGGEK